MSITQPKRVLNYKVVSKILSHITKIQNLFVISFIILIRITSIQF